ncbi:MAG: hypothetical protein U0694_28870 [Anaerolineae bacterium]
MVAAGSLPPQPNGQTGCHRLVGQSRAIVAPPYTEDALLQGCHPYDVSKLAQTYRASLCQIV